MTQIVPVLVSEDTIYRESRKDQSALLSFWRTPTASVPVPWYALRTTRPPPEFFEQPFSVYPIIEAFGQTAAPTFPGGAPLFVTSYRPPDVEEEYRRVNHQLFFQIQRTYGLQLQFCGYTVEVPDFNDAPWLEWVHPPASPESAIFPFRQIYPSPVVTRGQQFNLYWDQPRSPRLDPEPDIQRNPNLGIYQFRQTLAVPAPLTTCGRLDVYDYGNGSVLLAWGPFIGGIPDSYNVYVNGVFNQSIGNPALRLAVISGLFGASYNGVKVTPATTYQLKVVAVSAGSEVAESDTLVTAQPTSVMLVTPMRRIFPFPNTGLN